MGCLDSQSCQATEFREEGACFAEIVVIEIDADPGRVTGSLEQLAADAQCKKRLVDDGVVGISTDNL